MQFRTKEETAAVVDAIDAVTPLAQISTNPVLADLERQNKQAYARAKIAERRKRKEEAVKY